jgi:hypothetical protein
VVGSRLRLLSDYSPIILMTAGSLKRAQSAEADVVLHTPFNILKVEQLLQRVPSPPGHYRATRAPSARRWLGSLLR